MAATPSKRVVLEQKRPLKRIHSCTRLIYDDPYIFRVRSERSQSAHVRPCEACLIEAKRQQSSSRNIQYQQKCSRVPPTPVDIRHIKRSKTAPSNRTSNECSWDNFMKRKSKHAIKTPYALCDLNTNQEDLENRPPFINYGGRYNGRHCGQKHTFNSFAIHQLKHHEADDQRLTNLFRERHLRHQAENYFRQMERRKVHE